MVKLPEKETMSTMNIKEIIETLQNLPGVSAWELRELHKKSFQRYMVFDQLESQRVVEKLTYLVTLYKTYNYEGQKVLGESTVSLVDGDRIRERLRSALEMAALVANPIFSLPEKGSPYDRVQTADPDVLAHPIDFIDQIQEDFFKGTLEKVKRSAVEIFVENNDSLLLNSSGLDAASSETDLSVEFALLAEKDGKLEGESQGIKRVRFYEDLHLMEMVHKYAQYARERMTARLPNNGIYPVVFSEEALDTLFNYFCVQASGPAQYQHWTQLTLGEPVITDLKGEPLTLVSSPGLKGGMKSRAFDDNGLPLHRVEVIQNNLFRKRMNNKRYADYLQEEATGNFTNIEVATGSKPLKEFFDGAPCYHLLRFSTFEPNPITGAFSAEIRTGYFIKEGKMIPIKGGSVSGVMQEAFREVFFSQEPTQRSAFRGPEGVRFERLAIAGN
jgi:PmbA protein